MAETLDLGNLLVHINARDAQFRKAMANMQKQINEANRKTKTFGSTLKTAVAGTVTIYGLYRLARGFALFKNAARDAVESENLFRESMGAFTQAARVWSQELQNALGLNEYAVRQQVGVFNVMLNSMGLVEEQAYEMSKGLTRLAYDMASFYNLDVESAFEKLRSGITGMVRPLKDLGIIVDETTVKEWALREGWIKQGQELSQTGKAYARYNVILEATQKAQGDMARTALEVANMERRLGTTWQRLKIQLGNILLPAWKSALMTIGLWLEANLEAIVTWTAIIIEKVGEVAKALLSVGKLLKESTWDPIVGGASDFVWKMTKYWMIEEEAYKRATNEMLAWQDKVKRGEITLQVEQPKLSNPQGILGRVPPTVVNDFNFQERVQTIMNELWREEEQLEAERQKKREDHLKELQAQLAKALEYQYKAIVPPDELIRSQEQKEKEALEERMQAYQAMSGQMGRLTVDLYLQERNALNHLAKTYLEATGDIDAVTAWKQERLRLLQIEFDKTSNSIAKGFKAAGEYIKHEMKTWGERAFEFSLSMESSLESSLMKMSRDFDNFGEHVKGVLQDLYYEFIRLAFMQPLASQLAGGFSTAFGNLTKSGFGNLGATDITTQVPVAHSGGIGKSLKDMAFLPSSLWRNAPKFHGGKGDMAAWIKQNEHILTPDQMDTLVGAAAGGNVQININNTGSAVEVDSVQEYMLSDKRIIDVTLKAARENASFRRTMNVR